MPIDEAIHYYHDLLESAHLQSTVDELARATEADGLAFGGRPVCTVLRPYFIEESRYEFVMAAAQQVMLAISSLARRLPEDESLRRYIDLLGDEEALLRIDTGYGAADISARLDGFLGPSDTFHFVEYNGDSPGGLAYGDALAAAFAAMPIMKSFGERYAWRALPVRGLAFDALLGAYHRWGGRGLPKIAIVDWRGVSTYSEFVLMQRHFESHGCEVRICDPDDLEYRNGRLVVEDFAIDLVYKRVVVAELLEKRGLDHPLFRAARERAVCVANGFGVQALSKKTLFALLSDPAHSDLFHPEVAAALQRHIPWTRRVQEAKTVYEGREIDLLPFIAENRERLVLKTNGEYGGRGVVLGWEVEDEAWQSAIQEATRSPYVVQERVPVGREPFPSIIDGALRFDHRNYDLDPYVWHGDWVCGAGVRLSSLALLNVTAGGGSATPMFIVRG